MFLAEISKTNIIGRMRDFKAVETEAGWALHWIANPAFNQFESDCGLLDTIAVEGWCPDLSDIQVVLEFNSQCCYLSRGKWKRNWICNLKWST